jgi:DNA polymerase III delta prime subunit
MRPTTLSGLFGQEKIVEAIRNHVATRPPRVWLFSGDPGCGKTTIAKIMSLAYQCTHQKLWGDPCKDCRTQTWAIHEVNAAEHSGIEEVERLIHIADHRPLAGQKRVLILDECQNFSASAWKALLKPTEETPEHAVWIFCTSELRKVPAANQRRPVKYALRSLNINETEAFLRNAAQVAKVTQPLQPLFDIVHQMEVTSPGVLLQALEKYSVGCAPDECVVGVDGAKIDTYNLCKALTSGNWSKTASYLREATPDHARLIRAFVASWLKGGLTKMKLTPKAQEAAALGLIDLANAPYDDGAILFWLHGVLWKICNRYNRA